MKNKHTATIGVIILLFGALAGAILWLGNADIAPPTQTVTQVLPDDHIPR